MKIGIDLGGTSVSAGLVDENFKIIHRTNSRTSGIEQESDLVACITDCAHTLLRESGVSPEQIEMVGIGSPGKVSIKNGTVIAAGNLPFRDTPIVDILSKQFGKPVLLENDANCAAWGEYHAGAGKFGNSLVMITLGTGIGGGIVVDGKILHGNDDQAGEIGHIVIDMNGKRCSCGRKGCWETLSSTKALVAKVKAEAEQVPFSVLGEVVRENGGKVDGRTLFTAYGRGCRVARSIFIEYIELLAVGTMNIIEMFRPDIIVFGGGISKEGEKILTPLREVMDPNETILAVSALGDNAGIIGASLLDLR